MTLRQLELLVIVADRGSISAAAAFSDLTQPTVSYQLQQLEQELGVRLLERKSRGMTLTEEGQLVVSDARNLLKIAHEIPVRLAHATGVVQGQVSLGLSPVSPVSTHHFPAFYRKFHQNFPGVMVSVVEEGSLPLIEQIHEGSVDLAIMSLPLLGGQVDISPLWQEELLVISSIEEPAGRPLDFKQLHDRSWVLFKPGFGLARAVRALCQNAGFDPKQAAEVSTLGAIVGFVAAGLGISMIPREAAVDEERAKRVKVIKLTSPIYRPMALVTSRHRALTPAAHALADVIKQYAKTLAATR